VTVGRSARKSASASGSLSNDVHVCFLRVMREALYRSSGARCLQFTAARRS
jgi:hypothetical protein